MIDLHMHSSFSDGKDDLDTLIDNVAAANISTFALTDHDTAAGCREILKDLRLQEKLKKSGLQFVVGAEFSCIYEGYKVHILAYDFDPESKEVLYFEKQMADLIKEKDVYRLKAIEDAGYTFSRESKAFLASRLNIRKVDVANCLVGDGYFDNIDIAIQSFLNNIKYPKKYKLSAEEVIKTLSKAGAKMVWAHSLHGYNEKPITLKEVQVLAEKFKSFGLAGLECYYSLYNKQEISGLKDIANRLGLFVTAGSDYHGKNKATPLGMISADGTMPEKDEINLNKLFESII